jgi:hypothetical protein
MVASWPTSRRRVRTSQITFIKELRIGITAGVLVDATVVRAFLVRSLMALLVTLDGARSCVGVARRSESQIQCASDVWYAPFCGAGGCCSSVHRKLRSAAPQ